MQLIIVVNIAGNIVVYNLIVLSTLDIKIPNKIAVKDIVIAIIERVAENID